MIVNRWFLCSTTANGDLPNRQHTVVAVTSDAKVTITTTGDGKPKQHTVKSPAGEVSVRPYCHATCESSYNQLKVDDTLFIPNNGSVDIISGHHPETATHYRVSIPSCDPLTATFEKAPNIIVYILCSSGSWESNSLTVFGVREQSESWSATEPYTCKLADTVNVDDVGLFFRSQEGEIYVAFASSMGLGVCSLKTDTPFYIDFPSNCFWIAKLSQFDPMNILVECTSDKDSPRVVAVWLFSVPDASFTLQLPQQHYDVGQIAFSANRLICVTWKDTTLSLTNLSEINPPSATIVTKRNVDSAHIVGMGIASQLVVVTKGGVQQYNLHAVFDGNTETTTLEGSENVLTRFDDPTCPMAQVKDQHIIIPTHKDTTYGMALLSLNGDKPEVINGIRPARFATYSGIHVTNPTEVTVENVALTVSLSTTIPIGAVILMAMIVIALVVIAVIQRRKKEHIGYVIVFHSSRGVWVWPWVDVCACVGVFQVGSMF